MKQALGKHLLVELYECSSEKLNDVAHIEQSMIQAAREAGTTIINTSFHHFSPYGVSGVVVIQESHLSIHTWPEYGFAAVDIFTCGNSFDPRASCNPLEKSLQAKRISTREVHRGIFNQLNKGHINPPLQEKTIPPKFPPSRNIWFTIRDNNIALSLRSAGVIFQHQSLYQKVEIFDTYGYGKMLVLDGHVMCTEKDEYVYHEMITHVPMLTHPNPEQALIIGGGDGGAARELLRHDVLKHLVLIEIDDIVVEASRKYLPAIASSFDDPRLTLKIQNGIEYLQTCPDQSFDLIVVDATHPTGHSAALFKEPFYHQVHRCLKTDGILTAQTESPTLYSRTFKEIYHQQRKIFGNTRVHCYLAFIPTYTTGLVSFSYASKGSGHPLKNLDPRRTEAFVEKHSLKYYNRTIHEASFALPSFLENLLNETL